MTQNCSMIIIKIQFLIKIEFSGQDTRALPKNSLTSSTGLEVFGTLMILLIIRKSSYQWFGKTISMIKKATRSRSLPSKIALIKRLSPGKS